MPYFGFAAHTASYCATGTKLPERKAKLLFLLVPKLKNAWRITPPSVQICRVVLV